MAITLTTLQHPLRIDETGTIRVGLTRITFDSIVGAHRRGDAPELIAQGFPDLRLEDIYATITYYLSHKEELDAYLVERERQAEEFQRSHPQMFATGVREKLLARLAARGKSDDASLPER